MLLKAAPCVACASVDLDGQGGVVVDVPREVYELVRLVVHLTSRLYAKYGGGIPFMREHMILVVASDTIRPNAVYMAMITPPIIFLGYSGECETTPASSA